MVETHPPAKDRRSPSGMRVPWISPRLARWLDAVPEFCFAATLAFAWLKPTLVGPSMMMSLGNTFWLELLGIFVALSVIAACSEQTSRLHKALLYLLYVLMFAGWGFGLHDRYGTGILISFCILLGNRLLWILARPQGEEELKRASFRWMGDFALFLASMYFMLIPVPALGLTPATIASLQRAGAHIDADGLPSFFFTFVMYFILQGLRALYGEWLWVKLTPTYNRIFNKRR